MSGVWRASSDELSDGRHLAAIACGRCHGTDLGGIRDVGPDMTVRGYYSSAQFHALIQKGDAIGEGVLLGVAREIFKPRQLREPS